MSNMIWQDIPGWFTTEEAATYAELIARAVADTKECNIAEVGSFLGRSAASVGPLCRRRGIRLFCIDPWKWGADPIAPLDSIYAKFLANMAELDFMGAVVPIRMTSVQAAVLLGRTYRFRLVFIDAMHEYAHVKEDIQTWLPLVEPGGILAGHDYYDDQWPGVKQAVQELLPGYKVGGGSVWYWRKPDA